MHYQASETVALTAQKIFAIISDVENYHEFLPWCQASRVLFEKQKNHLIAELVIGFGHIHERFISEVTIHDEAKRVNMQLPDLQLYKDELKQMKVTQKQFENRTVKQLYAYWQLEAIGDERTIVTFSIDFTMHSRLYNQMLKMMMGQTIKHMSRAFIAQAKKST